VASESLMALRHGCAADGDKLARHDEARMNER